MTDHPDDETRVLDEILSAFRSQEVTKLFNVSTEILQRHADQFRTLEQVSWDTVRPEGLVTVVEPTTFLSPGGFQYLFPKVANLTILYGVEATKTDFVDTFFRLPLTQGSEYFKLMSGVQKRSTWHFYQFLADVDGLGLFPNWSEDGPTIRSQLG